ncbi:MAG: DUF2961 domain-containing protein, partial [Bacteroidales bacterium]|nr:DUF2961 domain-containing protein [Bacteroidales bacterium]
TFGNKDAYTGTLRIYLDDQKAPVIEGPVLNIISGGVLVGEPLSSSVSPETDYSHRGHNLYLPIPYARHCIVSYECTAIDTVKHSPSVYYNIDYRTYDPGTRVVSFSFKDLTDQKTLVAETLKTLNRRIHPEIPGKNETSLTGLMAPGDTLKQSLTGRKAIYRMDFKIDAANLPQALRSTMLEISFDGEPCVYSPIGDFFGTGYQIRPYTTWHTQVTKEGLMSCFWTMPFKKGAVVSLINLGDQEVQVVTGTLVTGTYHWTHNSMHFGALWHEYHNIETAGNHWVGGTDKHFDIHFALLKGQGIYAGDALTVFNTADSWWGEGDEKVYVDKDTFPSFVGTGTEDYIGYAWCRPEPFSHFLIAQPDGSGNFHPGMTINMRHRMLDGVTFRDSLRFDMELWHWAPTRINYAIVSYWYMRPGGESMIKPDMENAKKQILLKREDLIKPVPDKNGILEGENLRVTNVTKGSWQVQNSITWGWSNHAQLWWMNGGNNGRLTAEFKMPEAGTYRAELVYTKAIDYGNFIININGKETNNSIIGYHDPSGGKDVITAHRQIGQFHLKKGANQLTLKITGKQAHALPRYMVGIDYIRFTPVNRH